MKLLTQKLEQNNDIFREPIKKMKNYPRWMRGNKPATRLVSKGGTKVRFQIWISLLKTHS